MDDLPGEVEAEGGEGGGMERGGGMEGSMKAGRWRSCARPQRGGLCAVMDVCSCNLEG